MGVPPTKGDENRLRGWGRRFRLPIYEPRPSGSRFARGKLNFAPETSWLVGRARPWAVHPRSSAATSF